MKSLKTLFAGCSLLLSSMAMSQAVPMNPETGYFWIDGKVVTIAYSSLAAPSNVSTTTMLQVMADVETKLESLNIPGIQVAIDTNVRTTGCSIRDPNVVVICWTPVETGESGVLNVGGGSGINYWREANVMLGTQASWTGRDMLYMHVMHQMMHILGFSHPNGSATSVLNGAADLTQMDIDGLRAAYSASRCAVTLNSSNDIVVPYVTYRGNAYKATLHYNGGASFTLLAPSISMYSAASMPLTPCQGLAVDGTNQVTFPHVNVNGSMYHGTLRLEGGSSLTLIDSGRNP